MDHDRQVLLAELYEQGRGVDAAEPDRLRRRRNLEPDSSAFLRLLVLALRPALAPGTGNVERVLDHLARGRVLIHRHAPSHCGQRPRSCGGGRSEPRPSRACPGRGPAGWRRRGGAGDVGGRLVVDDLPRCGTSGVRRVLAAAAPGAVPWRAPGRGQLPLPRGRGGRVPRLGPGLRRRRVNAPNSRRGASVDHDRWAARAADPDVSRGPRRARVIRR